MIEVKNLTKKFGKHIAVNSVSLSAAEGDIYGFIGHNGAGKSTTFKILSTILKPDSGSIRINDVDIREGDKIRGLVGYMPDMFGVYEDMTVFQYLDFFGAAYYIPMKERTTLIADILELTDLTFKKDAMVQSLSRGMTQRLGIARVLIHDPKVLILDEPASGLDPRARIELRELLRELARMGKTILISSHILVELSEICTRIGIIEQGRQLFEGSKEELNHKMIAHTYISIQTPPEQLETACEFLKKAPFTQDAVIDHDIIRLKLKPDTTEIPDVPGLLIGHGCRIYQFQPADLSLENAFMALTEGKLA